MISKPAFQDLTTGELVNPLNHTDRGNHIIVEWGTYNFVKPVIYPETLTPLIVILY